MKNKVVIVGGGMVGAAAAVSLAKKGAEVVLIEHSPINATKVLEDNNIDIRVSAINRFSERLLDNLGAMPLLRATRVAPYHRLSAFESGRNILSFDKSEVNATHLGHIIENRLIQASLWSQFPGLPITVKTFSTPARNIQQDTEKVVIVYDEEEIVADLIIATDGGRSQVRKLAGIGVTGWQYQQHCMGILIKLEAPQQTETWQQFKATGPVALLPMHAPYANLIWYDRGDTLKRASQLTKPLLKQAIFEHFPSLPGDFDVIESAVFPLTRQHANDYVQGRVVLVGDAAHTINPLAGQGVNLGFKDVAALTEALDFEDVGHLSNLNAYQKRRRFDNALMMSTMDACYFGFSNEIRPLRLFRELALRLANSAGPIKAQVLKHAMGE
ncbi:2-octaprenyl-3-methyl-6-methoxy-1,4-benzoquinol hydroxylase [Pseudoalteromonas luteoviolacea B = ATCC 29581]|nr:2-octaprenyl-3-methyl-6-methoxy-1,4-benzoquinol hydroxylase [Pseudoalteromonas luteoviolacea B = ATCC 29581]